MRLRCTSRCARSSRPERAVAVETADGRAIVVIKREARTEEVDVLAHPVCVDGLGNHDDAAANEIAEHDLRGRHAMLGGNGGQRRIAEDVVRALGEPRPRLEFCPALLEDQLEVELLAEDVRLVLVERRDDVALVKNPLILRTIKTAQTDRLQLPVLERVLQGVIGLHVRSARPVDDHEVDRSAVQRLVGLLDAPRRRLIARLRRELGRHENLLARDAERLPSLADGLPDLTLVAVVLGGINKSITGLERLKDRLSGLRGRDLIDAEADHRDLRTGVEGGVAHREGARRGRQTGRIVNRIRVVDEIIVNRIMRASSHTAIFDLGGLAGQQKPADSPHRKIAIRGSDVPSGRQHSSVSGCFT